LVANRTATQNRYAIVSLTQLTKKNTIYATVKNMLGLSAKPIPSWYRYVAACHLTMIIKISPRMVNSNSGTCVPKGKDGRQAQASHASEMRRWTSLKTMGGHARARWGCDQGRGVCRCRMAHARRKRSTCTDPESSKCPHHSAQATGITRQEMMPLGEKQ